MKVVLNTSNQHERVLNVPFRGYKPIKNEFGFKEYEFSYPFDEDTQNCYLEVYSVNLDPYENFRIENLLHDNNGLKRQKLSPGSNKFNFARMFGLDANAPFAYHYVVENKNNPSDVKIRIDAGDSVDNRPAGHSQGDSRIYNVVNPKKSLMSKGGSMKLIIPDAQNVGVEYAKDGKYVINKKKKNASASLVKNLWNRLGGNLAGVEKDIDDGQYDMYSRILSLPIFGRDRLSAHGYWSEELFQIAPHIGNINNYSSVQRKLFAHGINLVADGAFVNEGIQGVHFSHILRYGENSPFFNWFNGTSLEGKVWNLGIFPKNSTYTSHKTVNFPLIYKQDRYGDIRRYKNPLYDSKKSHDIQYFDKRLVSEEQANDTQNVISSYTRQPDNIYLLNSYNDSLYPYHISVDPEEYDKNISRLIEYNKAHPNNIIRMDSYEGARILSKFSTWNADEMFEGGFETWNANPDIPKLKFVFSNEDYKRLKNLSPEERNVESEKILRANAQVRDYTIEAGKYWTKMTNDIHRLYIAQNLKNISNNADDAGLLYRTILDKSDDKIFPRSLKYEISKNEVENVLSGVYNYSRALSQEDKQEQVLRHIMDFPLESLEFGSNIISSLATPYISKRANTFDEIGMSRYDLYKNGTPNLEEKYRKLYNKTEDIMIKGIYPIVMKALEDVNTKLPKQSKLFDNNSVTEYGQHVLSLIVPAMTKYILVKSLIPDLSTNINSANGEITYDYDRMNELSLEGLGIGKPLSPEDEANKLLNVISSGVEKFKESDQLVKSAFSTLKGTSLESFRLADLIIDKTQAGLDWRIDAAKDIADVEALNNQNANFEDTMQSAIDFWSQFVSAIYGINPNAYIVPEITDTDDMHRDAWGRESSKYPNNFDIVTKLLRETGMISPANYTFLFNDQAKMFSKSCEDASYVPENEIADKVKNILIGSEHSFLKFGPLESVLYSYNFVGNHDKPRILHCAALDMGLYNADLCDANNREYRKQAYMILNNKYLDNISDDDINSYDFSKVSPKAVAMGMAIHKAAIDVLNEDYSDLPKEDFNKAFEAICMAVTDLVSGRYMGKYFEADAFGVNPFDVNIDSVVKQAKTYYKLPPALGKDYSNKVFEKALDPAISKLLGMMKYLVAMPGLPTLFDGDDYGATGGETKTRNMYIKGRSKRHEEWTEKSNAKYKKFIDKHRKEFEDVMAIRRKPECNALNNGGPFDLPMQCAYNAGKISNEEGNISVPALFRLAPDGRMAICLFNPAKHHDDPSKYNKYDFSEYYTPEHLQLKEIRLNYGKGGVFMDGGLGVGIFGLKAGTKFYNANNPKDVYEVMNSNGYYYLKRQGGKLIDLDDSTLILYHADNKPLSFTGRLDVKTPMRDVVKAYNSSLDSRQVGQNLLLAVD